MMSCQMLFPRVSVSSPAGATSKFRGSSSVIQQICDYPVHICPVRLGLFTPCTCTRPQTDNVPIPPPVAKPLPSSLLFHKHSLILPRLRSNSLDRLEILGPHRTNLVQDLALSLTLLFRQIQANGRGNHCYREWLIPFGCEDCVLVLVSDVKRRCVREYLGRREKKTA